jgi:hypothetical protein
MLNHKHISQGKISLFLIMHKSQKTQFVSSRCPNEGLVKNFFLVFDFVLLGPLDLELQGRKFRIFEMVAYEWLFLEVLVLLFVVFGINCWCLNGSRLLEGHTKYCLWVFIS